MSESNEVYDDATETHEMSVSSPLIDAIQTVDPPAFSVMYFLFGRQPEWVSTWLAFIATFIIGLCTVILCIAFGIYVIRAAPQQVQQVVTAAADGAGRLLGQTAEHLGRSTAAI